VKARGRGRPKRDTRLLSFGGIFTGNALDRSFMVSAFKDVSGSITITPPAGYAVSTNGTDDAPSATITADPAYVGSVVSVRFSPADSIPYNGDLTVGHSTLTPTTGTPSPTPAPGRSRSDGQQLPQPGREHPGGQTLRLRVYPPRFC
jgi:hypothetical protein